MKNLLLAVIILSAVNLFAQEKPDAAKQRQEIQLQAQQLQQELRQKLTPLKADVYDAQKLIEFNEKEIMKITEEYQNKFAELQKKFDSLKEDGNKK